MVIGATNRIDSIDPALRRPGRFDRELLFSLPSRDARKQILRIHTRKWKPPVAENILQMLAERTAGFCGADLEAVCREAFLHCFRRCNPRAYETYEHVRVKKQYQHRSF